LAIRGQWAFPVFIENLPVLARKRPATTVGPSSTKGSRRLAGAVITIGQGAYSRRQTAPEFCAILTAGHPFLIESCWISSSELRRVRKMSLRPPRSTCRTSFLPWPVWRTICLIASQFFNSANNVVAPITLRI
jgi:hypothetical protein